MFEDMPIISMYSRAQAIEDGVLVDVTKTANDAGFKFPTVVTAAVQAAITDTQGEGDPAGRLWDVLSLARFAVTGSKNTDRVPFKVKIGRKVHDLIVHIGPGDDPTPVLTIAHPIDL